MDAAGRDRTRDAFVELVMDEGCDAFPMIKAMKKADKKKHKALCQTVREDGGYVEAGENDNLIVKQETFDASLAPKVEAAVKACPRQAIRIVKE